MLISLFSSVYFLHFKMNVNRQMHSGNLTVLYKMIMYATVSFCNSICVS